MVLRSMGAQDMIEADVTASRGDLGLRLGVDLTWKVWHTFYGQL
jgi:hypothetical protein